MTAPDKPTAALVTVRNREGSHWLRTHAAQLMDVLREQGHDLETGRTVLDTRRHLRRARPGSLEDRVCDRCRMYVPTGTVLWAAHYRAAERVVIGFALCGACKVLEVGE